MQITNETIDGQRYLVINEHRFKLKPLNHYWIQRYKFEQEKKRPQPPVIEVTLGTGKSQLTRFQENTGDPAYQEALARWQSSVDERMVYLFLEWGIDEKPPKNFTVYGLELATEGEKKLAWFESFLGGSDTPDTDLRDVINIILGQNEATREGIEEAEARFPSESDGSEGLG